MSESDHSTPVTSPDSAFAAPVAASPRQSGGIGRVFLVILILLALVLAAALYEQNRQYRVLQIDFQRQHDDNVQLIRDAHSQAAQALSLAREQSAQVQDLRGTLEIATSQLQELDQALQLMTDSGSDLLLLNDIDQLITIAQQQLSLGGNVANAIISLEAAQAQLARANRPGLAALQQSINGDLDRLRAVATINLPAVSARLDQLSDLIGTAPLLVPDAAATQGQPLAATESAVVPVQTMADQGAEPAAAWQGWLQDGWHWTQGAAAQVTRELRSLFDIRRVSDSAALLMSPDQAQRFRDGLKQRTTTAQLALMMHQSRIWKAELDRVAQAIEQRYDMQAESSRQALTLARALHDTPIEVTLPTLGNSLAAIAAARDVEAARENDAAQDNGAGQDNDAAQDNGAGQDNDAAQDTDIAPSDDADAPVQHDSDPAMSADAV